MTQAWTLAFTLLLSAAWLQAQQYPQTGSSQSGSTTSGQATTVQGCLQGSNGNFTLTDNMGMTYQVQGDTSKLAEHVGHEVQITGASSTASSAAGSASRGNRQHELRVPAGCHSTAGCEAHIENLQIRQ